MSFQERIQQGFLRSMGTGIDYFIGVASVLMRIGEAFSGGARTMSLSPALLRPRTIYRLSKAFLASKLNGRAILPKDIWRPKGIVASGMDAQMYRHRIKELWGCDPLEAYACTEFGPIAYQAWGERKQGMTLVPDTAYWEFMPEAEYRLWKQQPSHRPKTVLMDELQLGKYVLVGTSLGGGAFIRYVIGDLIRVIALEDAALGIKLPQIVVESRAMMSSTLRRWWCLPNVLCGKPWVSLISARWIGLRGRSTIRTTSIQCCTCILREQSSTADRLAVDLDNALIETNEEYAGFHSILEINPIKVSILTPGTLQAYMAEKQAEGADLGQLKPPRMQPPDQIFDRLLATSARLERKLEMSGSISSVQSRRGQYVALKTARHGDSVSNCGCPDRNMCTVFSYFSGPKTRLQR